MLQYAIDEDGLIVPWFSSNEEDIHGPKHRARSQSDQPIDTDTATILVVDDDMANLALAEALLQAEGFQVRVAMDAASMFAVLQSCKPALILMDIQLPEVDGWELTRQLKADPATSGIPVIALTAYGKAGDKQKAREVGFVEFLSKPVSTRELPGIVRRHLVTG